MVAAIEETRALTDVDVQVAPAALERTTASVSKMDDGTKRRLGPMAMPQRASIGDRSAPSRVSAPVAPPARPATIAPAVKVVKVAPPAAPSPSPKRETAVRVSPFTAAPPPPPKKKEKEAELELVEVEEIQELSPEPKKKVEESDDIPLIS